MFLQTLGQWANLTSRYLNINMPRVQVFGFQIVCSRVVFDPDIL